jgi:hypothetical protein
MASHKGSEGVVKVGSNAIGELRSWNLEHSSSTIETTSMGDDAITRVAGLKSWSGSADALWDEADTAQAALTAGASVSMTFAGEGVSTGDTIYTGTAIVTGISRSASYDGLVEVSFTFEGDGDLSTSTAA